MYHYLDRKSSYSPSSSTSTLLSLATVGRRSRSSSKSSHASRTIWSSLNLCRSSIKWSIGISWNCIIWRIWKFGIKKYCLQISCMMEVIRTLNICSRKNHSNRIKWLMRGWPLRMNSRKRPIIFRLITLKNFWTNLFKKKTKKLLSQTFQRNTSNMVKASVQKLPTNFTSFMKIKCAKLIKSSRSTETLMEWLKLKDFKNTKMKRKSWNTCRITWKGKLKTVFPLERRKVSLFFMFTQI